MLHALVAFFLKNRALVALGVVVLIATGVRTMTQLPIEAFPDLTNNQVLIVTECPGMAAREVELLVSYPIETGLMGLPNTQGIRSVSKLGLSMVTLVLDDSVPTYFARQLVNERLQQVGSLLPAGITPQLGPVATAFGEVYRYTVESKTMSAREVKTLHDWTIRNQMRTVPGLSEVNTWGGETAQIEVAVDPLKLRAYGLTLQDVFRRVQENNENFSAGYVEHASERYTVLGLGRVRVPSELERVVVSATRGTPVLLRDVATVSEGSMQRYGSVTQNARGETVAGLTIMLKGENGRDVIERVKAAIGKLSLPEGVKLAPFYDQSEVINGTLDTVSRNLLEAGALVMAVLLLFLGNFRAALLVAAAIPLSMLTGFLGMAIFGVSANLMSLGAIDFGMIVDGAVVMVENIIGRLEHRHGSKTSVATIVADAAHEVARPVTFAVGIIIAVYLPVLFLEGLEGRMFRPMAITVCSALIGSLAIALFVIPAASAWALHAGVKPPTRGWFAWLEQMQFGYERLLAWIMPARPLFVIAALALIGLGGYGLTIIGSEFMPRLDEGSILVTTRRLPGISMKDATAVSTEVERIVMRFPEVRGTTTLLGRPDLATEAMGIYESDTYILLKPSDQWTAPSKEALIDKMSAALEAVPGVSFNFSQPMAMRLDEVISGIKADIAVKLFGPDPEVLEQLATRALRILSAVPGAADVQKEIAEGVPEIRIEPDRAALARYGLNVKDVRDIAETAIRGQQVSEYVLNQRRVPIVIRLPKEYEGDSARLGALPLQSATGERVSLSQVARVHLSPGPELVSREQGQRRIVVQSNVRGRDLGGFAADAQARMARDLKIPAGYSIDWGGQFENQARAMARLRLVVPLSIAIILLLLYATFGSLRQALMILLAVPFALVGGVAALYLRGLNVSLSASVGFIALSGVAVLNGIVMVAAINRLRDQGLPIEQAVLQGARSRLRPVLMTALVASLGFVPMATAITTGAEVQRPLASVVIGGLFTSTPLTLILLPLIYPWFTSRKRPAFEEEPEHVAILNAQGPVANP
jgi:heavy metal efflux system protein